MIQCSAVFLFSATLLICAFHFVSFKKGKTVSNSEQTKVLIHTDLGDIKVILYNETPLHRDNFIKLVKEGTINGTLFHRVIPNFMIQGGDPNSKTAAPGAMLGTGEVGYTIPAEFNANFIHKKGALAAARMGDNVNPSRASSGCQFYIVQGEKYTDSVLTMMEQRNNQAIKQGIFRNLISQPQNSAFKTAFIRNQMSRNADSLKILSDKITPSIDSVFAITPHMTYTPEQKRIYSTIGGTPHLDGQYTVFGEVISGLEVVDKIAALECDANNRPKKDIHMTLKLIK